MKQAEHAEVFEQVLLSYAEMCYSVAFTLTHNPDRAQDLARHVLTWAWHLRDSADAEKNIKTKLLEVLRERFLQRSEPARFSHARESAYAGTSSNP